MDRLKKIAAKGEEVKFIKQVPEHLRDVRKGKLANYSEWNKKVKMMILFL